MDKFPTTRDYWYSFIITLLLITFLFISFVTNPSRVNSELGLASTVASILLSFIAIIYTLVDSSNNKKTSSKIIEASEKISTITGELNLSANSLTDSTQTLINLELDKKLRNFENTISGLELCVTTMRDDLGSNIDEIRHSIDNVLPINQTVMKTDTKIDVDALKYACKYLTTNLDEQYYHANEIIYIFYKLMNADKTIFPFYSEYFSQYSEKDPGIIGKIYCILGCFARLKCINWDNNTKKATLFDDSFLEIVKLFKQNNNVKVQVIDDLIAKL